MQVPHLFRLGLIAFVPITLASIGCQGPQALNVGTHVGAGVVFENESTGVDTGTGLGVENAAIPARPRQMIDQGTYLYHEPETGKTMPFTIGMSRSAVETLIRLQGIVMTRRVSSQSGGPTVYVLGPVNPNPEIVVLLHFANDKLVLIDSPS